MSATRIILAATCGRRLLVATLLAAALGSAAAAEGITLKATYYITIAGFTIGRVEAEGRFTDTVYAAAIKGSTYGISRLVSDSQATLTGNGRISGTRVIPGAYSLATSEDGFETHVKMAMSGGSIVDVIAEPTLREVPDRVPLTPNHKRRVVDPVGAFMVALGDSGPPDPARVCERTVRIFDGWVRFDLSFYYKETKTIDGGADSYRGPAIVCAARYVPVAGHRRSAEDIAYMANNERLEAWLVPVDKTRLLVPYRLVIGTKIGDLVVSAKEFVAADGERHASAK
ncbi:MAG: DUF3108 domain-containing protein [Bauldia sp.]